MAEPTAVVADKGIRGGLNSTISAGIDKAIAVALNSGGTEPHDVILPSAGGPIFGISMEAIPQFSRGDVQLNQKAICTSGAAIAKAAAVATDVAGKMVTAGTGDIIVGYLVKAAAGADELIEVELAGPGGGTVSP
jgi:hypothetical protein